MVENDRTKALEEYIHALEEENKYLKGLCLIMPALLMTSNTQHERRMMIRLRQ